MGLRPAAYLSKKLTRPLRTKDGSTLRTVLDARTYMLALSEDREHRAQWQQAAELLLAGADIGELTQQIELALFFRGDGMKTRTHFTHRIDMLDAARPWCAAYFLPSPADSPSIGAGWDTGFIIDPSHISNAVG